MVIFCEKMNFLQTKYIYLLLDFCMFFFSLYNTYNPLWENSYTSDYCRSRPQIHNSLQRCCCPCLQLAALLTAVLIEKQM